MNAREKLEKLTHAWYGFGLFSGVITFLRNGFGFFSMFIAGASIAISLALTYFFGRRLLAKSSFWRSFLILMSVLAILGGTLSIGYAFYRGAWSIGAMVSLMITGLGVYMNVRSFRVLTDASVRAYFAT